MLSEEEQERIWEIITDDDFPEDKIYFSEDFYYNGGAYNAMGYAIVDDAGYSFTWNENDGINEYTIDRDDDAFFWFEGVGKEEEKKMKVKVIEDWQWNFECAVNSFTTTRDIVDIKVETIYIEKHNTFKCIAIIIYNE